MPRCAWATTEPAITYHDKEWGVPVHDDRVLFEFLTLEGAQAGLSWNTILKKRENYRKAFDGFRPEKIARYGKRDVQRLLQNEGIVRNRLKIAAAMRTRRAFSRLKKNSAVSTPISGHSLAAPPIQNRRRSLMTYRRARRIRRHEPDLLRRGFKFVGSTICYAFMQAIGMVNDHLVTCPRHAELGGSHSLLAKKLTATTPVQPRKCRRRIPYSEVLC